MTPDDRDLLHALRRQQTDLQQALERLNAQLGALEARANAGDTSATLHFLPPLPTEVLLPPIPPPFVTEPSSITLPPVPTLSDAPALPPVPAPKPSRSSFELHFGRWLTRLGALFGVIALALIFALPKVQALLGHVGLLALSAAISIVVVIVGERLEGKGSGSLYFGRAITAMALAWLYLTAYTAYFYEPLRVIDSPLIAGFLLLLWSIYVLLLAERKKSQFLALFSIILAYVSTAINPVGSFTMAADLILTVPAVTFLFRNGWSAVSFFSMVGTYLALLRRLVIDENGELVLDTSRTLSFWPYAIYLIGAWLIFTTAVILTRAPHFRGGKRLVFLSLNNTALTLLLGLTAYISGYGASAVGQTFFDTGFVFLITSRFAGFAEIEPVDVMGAYAAQGLALVTAGIVIIYTGITRGVLLLVESFLLGVAGAFAADRILIISTYVAAFFATMFLIWEIAVGAHHPWLLGFSGATVMLINAWNSRSEVRDSPLERSTVVLSTSCYCILATCLVYATLSTALSDSVLPPALALAALVLTFVIYFFSIFELPIAAQALLLAAQFFVLFPVETGEELPWWTTGCVAAVTLLLVTWWSRQRTLPIGPWTRLLTFVYALALADMAHLAVRPYLGAQGWIIGASLLSVAFLIYAAFTRAWAVAAAGQIFLALALYHFFFPPDSAVFPWTFWASTIPIMVVFATGRAAILWLRLFTEIPETWRQPLRLLAQGYLLLALAAVIRLVFGVVPAENQLATFLFLGTFLLSINVRRPSVFGVRCSFVLTLIGMWLYLDNLEAQARAMATLLNGLGMLLFLAQAPLLRHEGESLVSPPESWALILLSVVTSWIFVSVWVWTRFSPGYLAMGWALDALFLYLFGVITREPRLSWCGMAILIMAILRVSLYDVWGLPNGYRVLTISALALILLGVGYISLRRNAPHDRTSP